MKISEVISKLEEIQKEHGDLDVVWRGFTEHGNFVKAAPILYLSGFQPDPKDPSKKNPTKVVL